MIKESNKLVGSIVKIGGDGMGYAAAFIAGVLAGIALLAIASGRGGS